jgi:hypothetical protein
VLDPSDFKQAHWGGDLLANVATSDATAKTPALPVGRHLCLNASTSRMWFRRGTQATVTAAVPAAGTLTGVSGVVEAGGMFWVEITAGTQGVAAILQTAGATGRLVVMQPRATAPA